MGREHGVFVGYFRTGHSRKSIARYVLSYVPRPTRITVIQALNGVAGSVYVCRLSYRAKCQVQRAIRALNGHPVRGIPLQARVWVNRAKAGRHAAALAPQALERRHFFSTVHVDYDTSELEQATVVVTAPPAAQPV